MNIPSELRLDASDTSLTTLSSLRLPGNRLSRTPDSESSRVVEPCSDVLVPQRLRVNGEWAVDLWRRIVENLLTKEVLCLKLDETKVTTKRYKSTMTTITLED